MGGRFNINYYLASDPGTSLNATIFKAPFGAFFFKGIIMTHRSGRLIIHPNDKSTEFLKGMYRDDDTIVRDGAFSVKEIEGLINAHEQTIMMGHGFELGLFSVGQFGGTETNFTVIDSRLRPALEKAKASYIWCYAANFTKTFKLPGFATGMFISDTGEAAYMGVKATAADVEESNRLFVDIIANKKDPRQMYEAAMDLYGELALVNPVAKYNHQRLRYVS